MPCFYFCIFLFHAISYAVRDLATEVSGETFNAAPPTGSWSLASDPGCSMLRAADAVYIYAQPMLGFQGTGYTMKRTMVVAASVMAVALSATAGLSLTRQNPTPLPISAGAVAQASDPAARSDQEASRTPGLMNQTTRPSAKAGGEHPADASATSAYELVETDLRCQIDREASATAGHIRSTTDELCRDFWLEPLSPEEVFTAITHAAEQGNIRAQLDYALYASRIFEDERNSLDPDLIRDYKQNTVRFLESAGAAGESNAYVRLSDIYKNGILASKDPVMAYAYAEAFFRTGSSRYGASFLNNAAAGLDGAQLRRGKELANHLLSKRGASP